MANKYQIQATKPSILVMYELVAENPQEAINKVKQEIQKDISAGKFESSIEVDILDEKEIKNEENSQV